MEDSTAGTPAQVGDGSDRASTTSTSMIADSNAWGVAAFVLGLVGSVLGLLVVTFAISFVLGVLAVVFGLIGLRKPARRTMTAWGSGLGVASIAVSLVGAFLMLQLLDAVKDRVDNFDRELESVVDDAVDEVGDAVDEVAEEFELILDEQMDRLLAELDVRDNLVDRVVAELDAREAKE